MKRPTISACLLAAMALDLAWAADPPPRILILPFENHQADSSLDYLEEALPALLAEAVSRSDDYALVDRQSVDLVLSEQSLTLQGLTSPDTRLRMGRLLGATVMITGSFAEQGQDLLLTVRALDLQTGIVTVTAEARGPVSQLGQLVGKLYGRLAGGLDRRLPDLAPDQIDPAPLSNLHFMKGLGHYFSARYSQALAEFMLAAEDKRLKEISRLWLANAYLARQQYAHAYLELSRVGSFFRESEVAAKRLVCEKYLGPEDVRMIRELTVRQAPGRK